MGNAHLPYRGMCEMKRLVGRIGCPELKQMLIFNWISNVLVLENLVLRCLGFELFGQQHHALVPMYE